MDDPTTPPPDPSPFRLTTVEDYLPLIGAQAVERILKKARAFPDLHVVNVNSTHYGGGVAQILSSLTLLMNATGIETGWRIIEGRPDFFSTTKKMHNALQGADIRGIQYRRCLSTPRRRRRTEIPRHLHRARCAPHRTDRHRLPWRHFPIQLP